LANKPQSQGMPWLYTPAVDSLSLFKFKCHWKIEFVPYSTLKSLLFKPE
jgi:hypothetical protein